jgi:plasmid stabilization system protein ParE
MAAGATARRLEWSPGALDAYLSTLARIAADDPFTAHQIAERVQQSLASILAHPYIGTPVTRRGERRYPVPGTGHVLNYRVSRDTVRIQLWYRARRHVGRR